MQCADLKEKGILYLYRELPPPELAGLEEHLNNCPLCRQALADLEKTRVLMRQLTAPAPDPAIIQSIKNAALRQWPAPESLWSKLQRLWDTLVTPMPRWASVSALTVVCVGLVIGIYLVPLQRNTNPAIADTYLDNGIMAVGDDIEAVEWEWRESGDLVTIDEDIASVNDIINNL